MGGVGCRLAAADLGLEGGAPSPDELLLGGGGGPEGEPECRFMELFLMGGGGGAPAEVGEGI